MVDLVNVQELLSLLLKCPFVKIQLGKLTMFDSQGKRKKKQPLPGCCAAVAHLARLALSSLLRNGHRSHSYQLHKQQKCILSNFLIGLVVQKVCNSLAFSLLLVVEGMANVNVCRELLGSTGGKQFAF